MIHQTQYVLNVLMNQAQFPGYEQLLLEGKLLKLKEFAIWICMS